MIEKQSQIYLNAKSPLKNHLVAKIYFKTNDYSLGSDDLKVLDRLTTYCSLAMFSSRLSLSFVGAADNRGNEKYNMNLSEKRAQSVKSYVDPFLKCTNYSSSSMAKGKVSATSDLAEDRRVDIYINEEAFPKPKPRSFNWHRPVITESNYPYQFQLDNQDLFRPLIFKAYHPDYQRLWSKIPHLIERLEKLHTIQQDEYVWISPSDADTIIKLIDTYFSEAEIRLTVSELNQKPILEELAECLAIIYRGQYDVAQDQAEKDFDRSDFRYDVEFFAHKFNMVPPNTPYTKKY
jgi:hypothetical protein